MKKILLFILSNCLFIGVSAKTYYGPYSDYSSYTEEKIISNELIDVKEKKFYRAYEEIVNYEYLEENDLYEKTGNSKFILSEPLEEKPENVFEEKIYYSYYPQNEDTYLKFSNNNSLSLSVKDVVINDEIYKYNYLITRSYEYAFDFEKNSNRYEISLNTNSDSYSINVYLVYKNEEHFLGFLTNDNDKVVIDDSNNFFLKTLEKTDNKDFIGKLENTNTYYIEGKYLYEYKIVNKNYLDLYLDESDIYKLDYDDYKIYYAYRKRDKVEFKDEFLIDSYDTSLDSFITTEADYKVTSNIDYLVNGTYKINYILPFKTYTFDVTVDIKDNYINLIKATNGALNAMKTEYDEALFLVDKKNNEIKSLIDSSNDEYLNDEIIKCKSKLEDTEKNKLSLEETKVEAKKSSVIALLCLIIIYIYLFIAKKVER